MKREIAPKRRRWWKWRVGVVIVLVVLVLLFKWHEGRQEMALTLEWGRLAPFPASATDVRVSTEGSMFTRGFRAHFVAPRADVDAWLAASPGPRSATKEAVGKSRTKYVITPGGGAGWAELTVDEATGTVDVYVYWS
jgi:hypothetical protein